MTYYGVVLKTNVKMIALQLFLSNCRYQIKKKAQLELRISELLSLFQISMYTKLIQD